MTDQKKQEFTLRISQANKSQLVVILYELFFCYIDEAVQADQVKDGEQFKKALAKSHDCLNELIASLNMEQPLAQSLLSIYLFISHQIGLANGKQSAEPLADVNRLMRKLYETYKKDSASDDSAPVMDHAQSVYAGLTYGKNDLNESYHDPQEGRGFFA